MAPRSTYNVAHDQMNTPWSTWAYEQRLPKPRTGPTACSLFQLQSGTAETECSLFHGGRQLVGDKDKFTIWFKIDPSPLQSAFILELRCRPSPKPNGDPEDMRRYIQDRISTSFLTYDEDSPTNAHQRLPSPFHGHKSTADISGPMSFSTQLYNVRAWSYDDCPYSEVKIWTDDNASKRVCFAWNFDKTIGFRMSGIPFEMSDDAKQALAHFKSIITSAQSSTQPLIVVTPSAGLDSRFLKVTYPRLRSMPNPVPHSFWPWLQRENIEGTIIDYNRDGFDIHPKYVKHAFAKRSDFWFATEDKRGKPKHVEQAVASLPAPVELAELKPVVFFSSRRQYLAHVVGGLIYEAEGDRARPIVRLMTAPAEDLSSYQHWLRKLLLARNSHTVENRAFTDQLPTNWQADLEKVCEAFHLGTKQRDAVQHYFTHSLTLVSGLHGPVQSALVDAILHLEQLWEQKVMVCTRSTVAATDSSPLRETDAVSMIVTGSSRIPEGMLVSAWLQASAKGTLCRVLFIGNHKQRVATRTAPGNVFAAQFGMSLFERLILSGFSYRLIP